MRVGLVIYGSIKTLTGGYGSPRVTGRSGRGDLAPRRNHYPRALCDNASPSLVRRLTRARFDVLLQDERNIAGETPGHNALITHEQIPDFYDWLSRYVQLSNWRVIFRFTDRNAFDVDYVDYH